MPVDKEYEYYGAFISIEPVPTEYIESDDIVDIEFVLQNT